MRSYTHRFLPALALALAVGALAPVAASVWE